MAYEKDDWICGVVCRGRYADHAFSGESLSRFFADSAAFADWVWLFLLLTEGYEEYHGEFGRDTFG